MALPTSTANWHWKNKNVTRWAKDWFERELVTLSVSGDAEGEAASIVTVSDVEGDFELGQRKSKLITIYDAKLIANWEGTASDGTVVKGRVHIDEVSHETTIDKLSDYGYIWEITTSDRSAPISALHSIVQSKLRTALEAKFAQFPVDLLEIHGKDLMISADPSRTGTPVPATPTPAAPSSAPAPPAAPKVEQKKKPTNTATVAAEAHFMISAADLYSLLTDEKKIPNWTRAPAVSNPQPDAEYSLFGGGVKGKYLTLSPPNKIVQTWALQSPTWPSGHFGTLTTTLDQSSDSTKVTFSLEGVPRGQEDEIKRNIEGYYVHGFKSIGYVQLFPSPPESHTPSSSTIKPRNTKPKQADTSSMIPVIIITIIVLGAALATVPYFSSPPPALKP